MIYLQQNSELYNNDIRAMLQAFFDNEKVVLEKEGTRLSLTAEYVEDVKAEPSKGKSVTYTLEDEEGYHDGQTVEVNFLDKKLARNPLKAALYHMLSEYTGKELPWGSLTGVGTDEDCNGVIGKW